MCIDTGVKVCVVEDDRVGVKHWSDGRAAAVGQDAAEYLPVPVKSVYTVLQKNNAETINCHEHILHTVIVVLAALISFL